MKAAKQQQTIKRTFRNSAMTESELRTCYHQLLRYPLCSSAMGDGTASDLLCRTCASYEYCGRVTHFIFNDNVGKLNSDERNMQMVGIVSMTGRDRETILFSRRETKDSLRLTAHR